MFNVCYRCGEYRADKIVELDGPYAVCPVCGHRHPFRQLPLLIVSGASGAGKSTVLQLLSGQFSEAVLLEMDILWRAKFDRPDLGYRDFFETWLRMAKNIGQAGRPVVLFGAGLGVPANLEACVERRYFTKIRVLALTCDDETLARRLQERPVWRRSYEPAFIQSQVAFNRWFEENAGGPNAPIELLETSGVPAEATAGAVAAWIRAQAGSVRADDRAMMSPVRKHASQ